ncbi:unnamed protein product, partial [Tenebrio molitor]
DCNRRPQPRHPLRPSRRSLLPNRRPPSAGLGRDPRGPRQFGLLLHQPTFLQQLHRRRWRNRDRPGPRNSEFAADPNQRTCGLRQQRHLQMHERSRADDQQTPDGTERTVESLRGEAERRGRQHRGWVQVRRGCRHQQGGQSQVPGGVVRWEHLVCFPHCY